MDHNMADAVASAIKEHQIEGKGLRPVAEWTDFDVTDSGILFSALADYGLNNSSEDEDCDDSSENENIIDSAVSAIVFGAFHQDSDHLNIQEATSLLSQEGYYVAELKWNCVSNHTFCPIVNEEIVPSFGYYPFVAGKPVSMSVFPEEIQSIIAEISAKSDWRDEVEYPEIAGYFVTKKFL